jgi:hypothetical protein
MSLQSVSQVDQDEFEKVLEKAKQKNKGEVWIKLDRPMRKMKLQEYADRYGKEQNMNSKEIIQLKNFLFGCLDKNKLNKSKDVVYNKEERIISSIPALHFNQVTKNYTLKIMDTKRVSTLKSLTPKRHELKEQVDTKEISKEKVD